MLLFCPNCSNLLTVSVITSSQQAQAQAQDPSSSPITTTSPSFSEPQNRLECRTCPYQYILTKRYYDRKSFRRSEREDVIGGPGAWDNAQKQQGVQCPKEGCEGTEAAYFQVQIRSADEPMTSFFKCMTCDHRWREN